MAETRTSSRAPEVLVQLRRRSGEPLSAQLERQLRDAIRRGALRAGSLLPSTRALASELGVSRGLVVGAYTQLRAEGYLTFGQGAPPRVAETLPRPVAAPAEPSQPAPRFNFRPEAPDLAAYPREEWLRSYRAALKAAPDRAFGYGDARGALALRLELAAYLGRARGVVAAPEAMLVCGGFAQAIGFVSGVLRDSGRTRLAVENPGHAVIRGAVERAGLTTVPVRVDGDGIDVAALERTDADAVLVTPAHQFPTGVVLSPERRAALVAWARRRDGFVVEDDYDAEFRYDRAPVGAVQGLAPERVFYLGSASKTLAPALRLGWAVPPRQFVRPLVDEVLRSVFAPPQLEQLAFGDFIRRGELDRHLRRMRLVYRRRRDTLVRALARALPAVEVGGIAAGLHVVATLPPGLDELRVLDQARRRRLALSGLSEHRVGAAGPGALLLGYAAMSEAAIRSGVRELASAATA